MEQTIKFIEGLIEEMTDVNWVISEIVEFKEVKETGEIYAELDDGSTYEKQDDYYIYQIQEYEDCYSGTIIYPITITEGKALRIHYSC